MKRCEVDQAVFYRSEAKTLIVIVAHVDDLTIVASSVDLVAQVKERLSEALKITDLGEIHWILGISVRRDRPKPNVITRTRPPTSTRSSNASVSLTFRPLSMPMDPHVQLTTTQSPQSQNDFAAMRDIPYREAVGALMYVSLGTRPDITYAVEIVSQFNQNPGQAHWTAVKWIFAYLAGTRDLRLTFGGKRSDMAGFTDADGSMHEERRAISGYAFLVDGGAVSWSSKKQEVVALSTTEAEYVAVSHAAKEALWLRSLLGEVFGRLAEPTPSTSIICLPLRLLRTTNTMHVPSTIDIQFHFIRWVISEGRLKLIYCPTDDMVADTLTKALPSPKVKHFAQELGLRKGLRGSVGTAIRCVTVPAR
jgi:hypothetical protein